MQRHKILSTMMVLAIVAAVGLGGCSQDSEPIVSESVQPGPEESATLQEESALDSTYPIVDTMQSATYDASGEIAPPSAGEAFYGQDAQYQGGQASYTDNGDGTVTDNVTHLMWTQSPDLDGDGDIDADDKLSYENALATADGVSVGGFDDWRVPTIKELYSLIDFGGINPDATGTSAAGLTPFVDTEYFDFGYGDTGSGERIIDAQWATSTLYVDTTMNGAMTMFGVNFADGRIKGYPTAGRPGQGDKGFYVYYVRGNEAYGTNSLTDNGDGTVTDEATDLMWAQSDSGEGMDWEEALAWAQQANAEEYLGHSDWRLPDAKELQSIVDYTRAPEETDSAAIDPVFETTEITNEAGESDYPFFWSSTTHLSERSGHEADAAVYVSFGRAMGNMNGWMDVHGAGAQRSDPKTGEANAFADGRGPQGDAVRIDNYVRLVRDAS